MPTNLIPAHGGYRKLISYQTTEIIYDATCHFCKRFIRSYKLSEQMTGAARSGKQNIAEGCMDSGTSKKTELKLIGVARGSLEELLLDFEDYLRQNNLELWSKDHPKAQTVRSLAYKSNRSYKTYSDWLQNNHETAANT
ncbi:MAG: four helix bundle protein, partial [bacterium]